MSRSARRVGSTFLNSPKTVLLPCSGWCISSKAGWSDRKSICSASPCRQKQDAYNKEHGIVPKTIIKGVREILEISKTAEEDTLRAHKKRKLTEQERAAEIAKLEKEMREASKMLEFEYAAVLRDRIIELRGEK